MTYTEAKPAHPLEGEEPLVPSPMSRELTVCGVALERFEYFNDQVAYRGHIGPYQVDIGCNVNHGKNLWSGAIVGVWTAMHYSDSAHLVAAELEAKLTPIIGRDEQAATNLERARNWLRKRRQAAL
jgi:hypothetical protein